MSLSRGKSRTTQPSDFQRDKGSTAIDDLFGTDPWNIAIAVLVAAIIILFILILWNRSRDDSTPEPQPQLAEKCVTLTAPVNLVIAKQEGVQVWDLQWAPTTGADNYTIDISWEDLNDSNLTGSTRVTSDTSAYELDLSSEGLSSQLKFEVLLSAQNVECETTSSSRKFNICNSASPDEYGNIQFNANLSGPGPGSLLIDWDTPPDHVKYVILYLKLGATMSESPAGPSNFDEMRIVKASHFPTQRFTNVFLGGTYSDVNVAAYVGNYCGSVSSTPVWAEDFN